MSKDELPSIKDFNADNNLPSINDFIAEEKLEELPSVEDENDNNLPSINDFITEEKSEELPSIEDYVEKKEDILVEATQTIEDADGNSFTEIKDIVPPWPELVKMVNDVREDILDIPEIKYYDKELEDLAEQISKVRDEIPEVRYYEKEVESIFEQIDLVREHIKDLPEAKYYDEKVNVIEDRIDSLQTEVTNLPEVKHYDREIEEICSAINQVRSEISNFPKWINEVNEIPDFSWIEKTFSVIDDDFTKVNDSIDTLKENIQLDIKKLVEDNEVRHFESKIKSENEVKDLNTKLGEEKDKIWKELRDSSMKMWEYHREFKDDDRKLKKQILGEYNTLKQNIKKELKEVTEESVKTDELLLKYFTDLREEVSGIVIPEVKYYDDDLNDIRRDITSLKKLVQTIKTKQKNLSEGLLNEPPGEKEFVSGQSDPLIPMDQNFATLDDLSNHYRLFINRIQQQLSTLGGGGETRLEFLDDVDRDSAKVNGKFLKYDSSVGKWVGANASEGSGSQTLNETLGLGNTSSLGMSVGVTTVTKLNIDPVGSGFTYSEDLVVQGNARVTGILSIGTSSIVLDSNSKQIRGVEQIRIESSQPDVRPVIIKQATEKIVFVKTEEVDGEDVETEEEVSVGIGTTVSINTSGIITASSFFGDGSGLTGIVASGSGVVIQNGGSNVGTASTINFGSDLDATFSGGVATINVSIPLSALTDVNTSNLSGISTDYLMVYDPSIPGFKFVNPKTYFGINNDANPAPDIVDYGTY